MARPNPETRNTKTPTWKYVVAGILIVALIAALYYGFFIGMAEEFEEKEEPAVIEQRISDKAASADEAVLRASPAVLQAR